MFSIGYTCACYTVQLVLKDHPVGDNKSVVFQHVQDRRSLVIKLVTGVL